MRKGLLLFLQFVSAMSFLFPESEKKDLSEFQNFLKNFTDATISKSLTIIHPDMNVYGGELGIFYSRYAPIHLIHTDVRAGKEKSKILYNSAKQSFAFYFYENTPAVQRMHDLIVPMINRMYEGNVDDYRDMKLVIILFEPRTKLLNPDTKQYHDGSRIVFSFAYKNNNFENGYVRTHAQIYAGGYSEIYKNFFSRALSIVYPEFSNIDFNETEKFPLSDFGILNDYRGKCEDKKLTSTWE